MKKLTILLLAFLFSHYPLLSQRVYPDVTELDFGDGHGGCELQYQKDDVETILRRYPNVKRLSIGWCGLKKIPETTYELRELEYLDLRGNSIDKVSKKIGNMVSLRIFLLDENQLTELPESIGRLMNLEKLILSDNQIEYLPEGIINLVNMQYLEGARNKFNINHVQLYYSRKDSTYKQGWESKYGQTIYKSIFKKSPFIPEAYTVTASSGLSVREKPNLKAKKIGTMPHKLRIAIYEESKNTETIDGITAPWMRIKAVANNKYMEGWTWGGYLEKFVYTE